MYRQHRADRLFKRCQDCGKEAKLTKVILMCYNWHYRRIGKKYLCNECRIKELENIKNRRINYTNHGLSGCVRAKPV
jgi:hypothetical protein